MTQKKIKVLIVDDSPLIRNMFTRLLSEDPTIEVLGSASDPIIARDKIKKLNPDVITLDIEMPRMDGLSFLERIMKLRPMPVIMISSLTQKGASETIKALELGAFDYIPKPTENLDHELPKLKSTLIQKIKAAHQAKITNSRQDSSETKQILSFSGITNKKIIAIGASTGGVEALRFVLQQLPENLPPIIITQHMPKAFTNQFAQRLNTICKPEISEARNGQELTSGNIHISPGDRHLMLRENNGKLSITLNDEPPMSGHKPSVDRMFISTSTNGGNQAVGVIMTGMGKDGAQGLLNMRETGAITIGQNEESCVVYGMPKAANEMKALQKQCHLIHMAQEIINACETSKPAKAVSHG